jgi:sialate O-acetylesterase
MRCPVLLPYALFAILPTLFCATATAAAPKFAGVFSDHAVLQRDMAVPVWGTADAGSEIVVEFDGQKKIAQADANGKWRVKLDAMPASAIPRELKMSDAKNPAAGVVLHDILVGEVWIGSGQSNMDFPVYIFTADDPHLAANAKATYPLLRLLKKGNGHKWEEAKPESIAKFSAMLFSFGMPLQKQLNVPVGLMAGAVSGTPSGLWLSEEMYREDADCAAVAKKFAETYDYPKEKTKYDEEMKGYEEKLAKWKERADAAKKAGGQPPRAPRAPYPLVAVGECNRGKIGNLFESFIRPYVGYGIRGVLWDQGESRTAILGVDQATLMRALIRGWRKEWDQGDFPFLYIQKPSGGGPAWDYTNAVTEKANPFSILPTMVPAPDTGDYTYALHLRIMKNPNTFMVTSTDLGPGTHPQNKSGYGARGAMVAMNTVYGGKAEYCGPQYASHEIKADKVIIKFTHVGQGLAFRNGDKLQGFAVAGNDRQFVWADAMFEGDTVVVSSKTVTKPAAVRYAWANQFPWANLFNKDGLPAQPFSTEELDIKCNSSDRH